MNAFIQIALFVLYVILLPLTVLGFIRKLKAIFQNRIGPPVIQPFFSLLRLMKKEETASNNRSWIFDNAPIAILTIVLILGLLVPWSPSRLGIEGDDLFLIIYLMGLIRFISILSSLDCGSPLSGFAGSREATLSLLIEPAIVLSLVALAIVKKSTLLSVIFDIRPSESPVDIVIWVLVGCSLLLASIVELSRMPIDDPNTHLELTMVHEAMVIENSGRNLAITEFAYALRLTILYGLISQCFLHAICAIFPVTELVRYILGFLGIFALSFFTAYLESFFVKLKWTKTPEFIAYAVSLSFLGCFAALLRGASL